MAIETKTTMSLTSPTPIWVRRIVRGLTWITAIYAIISIQVNFNDLGMSVETQNLILKYMAAFTGTVSAIARFIGVQPVKLSGNGNEQ